MSRKSQHVVHRGRSWAIRSSGSSRSTKVYDTQREAIEAARRIARNQETELVIHGRDGRIREKRSYGEDPFPPRDRR